TGEADKYCTCMYISLRTRLRLSDGSMLHPDLIRLMRRLCRDGKFRKREPEQVFSMFESVSRGEELYIRPYKHRSHYDIDTFLAFEPSVYAPVIAQKLIDHRAALERFPEYDMIVRAFAELQPMDESIVPDNSLVREFIGGSSFEY
ncbi:MAG: nucleoside kinase, partial [Oscillospiraceae bacterium]|nr:nucleoside kinase [Oscillospiraceae bacterium]